MRMGVKGEVCELMYVLRFLEKNLSHKPGRTRGFGTTRIYATETNLQSDTLADNRVYPRALRLGQVCSR